ncbi:MAG: FtsX-like permease family protein [Mobilitalea sp.]
MKKRALWKDFFMEIKKTLNRFLSIFLIVALGVAFFAGLRATKPDMRLTADNYYDTNHLMDLRILSTLGLTREDVQAIANTTGVESVDPVYSTHVVSDTGNKEFVLEVVSITNNLNLYSLSQGRLPEKADEILLDQHILDNSDLQIGDSIEVASGSDKELTDTLKLSKYTIVGAGYTPYYLSFQRGNTDIGNGEVNGFMVTLPEAFNLEVYTTVYASVQGAKDLTVYTEAYDQQVEEVLNQVKSIATTRAQLRYDELYQEGNDQILQAELELTTSKEKAEAELQQATQALSLAGLSEAELTIAQEKLKHEQEVANAKFTEAEQSILEAKEELTKLSVPKWYVLDRNSLESYVEYEQNTDRIGAIAGVFPAIFFLVAALISLTTMTRMVEEQRVQIGTLKALGYSKMSIAMKYMLYALLATLGGSLAGAAVGLKVLPSVIITAYKILYKGIPEVITPFNVYYATLAAAISVLTVGIATFMACYKELLDKPASLMRPVAPKSGKRVLLERVTFLWRMLSFTWKATIRNLLRYKKRFFMTIFGIGGCMALLLVGFGIRDSIFVISTRQFSELMLYDASVTMDNTAASGEVEDLETEVKTSDQIASSVTVRNIAVDLLFEGTTKSVVMYVPEESEKLTEFIVLRNRIDHSPNTLTDDGVILTEHMARMLGIKVGDTIGIKEGDQEVTTKVSAITENYLMHYIYITPTLYQKLFDKEVQYNEIFIKLADRGEDIEQQVMNQLLKYPAASGVSYTKYFKNMLANVLVSLNIVVIVLIVAAGALAFVVLYNLNNININERRRELATIKVLGFYSNETAAYVYRENIVLTLMGIIFGIFFGILLHQYVITTVEIDMTMFGRNINPSSFVYSTLLTLLFSAFVNFVMFFKLKKINMVESLKSIE